MFVSQAKEVKRFDETRSGHCWDHSFAVGFLAIISSPTRKHNEAEVSRALAIEKKANKKKRQATHGRKWTY